MLAFRIALGTHSKGRQFQAGHGGYCLLSARLLGRTDGVTILLVTDAVWVSPSPLESERAQYDMIFEKMSPGVPQQPWQKLSKYEARLRDCCGS